MLSSLQAPSADWIRVQDTVTVRCERLDVLVAERGLALQDFNLLNIDVQGHELQALRGASALLPHLDAVLTELNHFARYDGCAMAADVDAALRAAGFTCVSPARHTDADVSDALYVRREVAVASGR